MQDNWTDLKRQYEAMEEEPTQNLWESLEAKLDAGNENIPQDIFVKKSPQIFWKYAAAAIILITISGLIWNYSFQKNQQEIFVKNKISQSETENLNSKNSEEIFVKNEIPQTEISIKENYLPRKKPQISISKTGKSFEKSTEEIENKNPVLSLENKDSVPKINVDKFAQNIKSPAPREKVSYIKADELLFGRELEKNRQQENSPKMGRIEFEKKVPKSIKILGIELLNSEEKE